MKVSTLAALGAALSACATEPSATSSPPDAAPPSPGAIDAGAGGHDADAADGSAQQTVTTVPLTIRAKYTSGNLGMFVPVRVGAPDPAGRPGGSTPTVVLDSGSSGLRVLSSALAPGSYSRTGKKLRETFGGGMVFDGEEAMALVALGDAVTPAPIVIHVVDAVSCAPSRPSCPASNGEHALTDLGWAGILGTGLRGYDGAAVFSPIAQMTPSQRVYTIHVDRGGTSGAMTIGGGAETYSFVQLARDTSAHPDGSPAWNDRAVPVCYEIDGAPVSAPCAPTTLIDSGTNVVVLTNAGVAGTDGPYLAAGRNFHASIDGAFTWPSTAPKQIYVGEALLGGFDRILGLPFFRAFDVAYDVQGGRIGFRPST